MNLRDRESNPKFYKISTLFFFLPFKTLDHIAALKIERKMPYLNITFDLYASIGAAMHDVLVISEPWKDAPSGVV